MLQQCVCVCVCVYVDVGRYVDVCVHEEGGGGRRKEVSNVAGEPCFIPTYCLWLTHAACSHFPNNTLHSPDVVQKMKSKAVECDQSQTSGASKVLSRKQNELPGPLLRDYV